jgi:hypothetical protein
MATATDAHRSSNESLNTIMATAACDITHWWEQRDIQEHDDSDAGTV